MEYWSIDMTPLFKISYGCIKLVLICLCFLLQVILLFITYDLIELWVLEIWPHTKSVILSLQYIWAIPSIQQFPIILTVHYVNRQISHVRFTFLLIFKVYFFFKFMTKVTDGVSFAMNSTHSWKDKYNFHFWSYTGFMCPL